ncbi:MAG: hypothetical protein OEX00_04140 [Gammaproteobacteria bacterium]|nr:hypothetical protein [Gammaproteobacteria bacterium]MDH5692089.1 hypothetical protein [Gammaproteobacteria bacterium]
MNKQLQHSLSRLLLIATTLVSGLDSAMAKTYKLEEYPVLVSPLLELWGDSPNYKDGQAQFNGKPLVDYKTNTFGPRDSSVDRMHENVNSLIRPDRKNTFLITDTLRAEKSYDWEKDRLVGIAFGIWRIEDEYEKQKEKFAFLDPNTRVSEIKKVDLDKIQRLFKGNQFVKPVGLKYWIGTKEEITGKDYQVEIEIDGNDPRFRYESTPITEYGFKVNYNFLLGQLKVNDIPIGRPFLEPRPSDPVWASGSDTYLIYRDWVNYFQKGKNKISFDIYQGDDHITKENDNIVLYIEHPGIAGVTFDNFAPPPLKHKFSPDSIDAAYIDIDKFPERCWEKADRYVDDKHRGLVVEKLKSLFSVLEKRDQVGLEHILKAHLYEREKLTDAATITREREYYSSYLKKYADKYKDYLVEPLNENDLEINTYFDGKLIQVKSKEYDSLYYGFRSNKDKKKKYFKFEELPTFLVMKGSEMEFCM